MNHSINSYDDLMDYLDEFVSPVDWEKFYTSREFVAPFVTQSTLPDENLVRFISDKDNNIKTAVEFGCGEGRNSIYMAKNNIAVTAYDISSTAIENAKTAMRNSDVSVDFICEDIFKTQIMQQYDFVYDSGMFHHLSPHRVLNYIDTVKRILKPNGYFGLTCFAWGENCADEIEDWEYYGKSKCSGRAYKKERLLELFLPHFDSVEIRKYQNGVPNTIQGLDFMWVCLFKNR